MAKLFALFLILIAIQFAIILYHAPTENNNITAASTPNSLWTFISDPTGFSSTAWFEALLGVSLLLIGAGVTIGNTFGFKTDFILFAGIIGGLMSMGTIFANLWTVIYSDIASNVFSCPTGCDGATLVTAILIGPWALYYLWSIVEWWRGNISN